MQTKTKANKVGSIILNVLVWAFLVFSILVTIMVFASQNAADGVPSLFGKSFITIKSDSMKGTFSKGDLLIVDKITEKEAMELGKSVENRSGEVIVYRSPIDIDGDGNRGDLNAHRIVERIVSAGGVVSYKTQGDNPAMCPNPDDYELVFTDVVGVWTGKKLGGVGGIIDFLRSSLGFFICVVLPMILFFIYEVYNLIKVIFREKMKKEREKVAVTAETEEEIKQRAIAEYLAMQAAQKAQAEQAEQLQEDQTQNSNITEEE